MKEFAYIHEEGKLPDVLANIPFFESFTAPHLNDILYSSYFIQCDPGDVIIEQGQEDARIFILLTGELDVSRDGEPLATISQSGEVFGEVAVVSGERRMASVQAKKNTLCLVIDQQFLHELKPEDETANSSYYAALYGFLSRILAARLKAAGERMAELEREIEELKGTAPDAEPPTAKKAAPKAKKAARAKVNA